MLMYSRCRWIVMCRIPYPVAGKRRGSLPSHHFSRRARVKKLLIVLLLAAACTTTNTVIPATSQAPSQGLGPRPALDQFLAAVRAQDLQAMSLAWGNKDGPVRDSKIMTRDEVERREVILICY